MEVFLEMRSGFCEFDEQVKTWKGKIHSLKFNSLTAASSVLLRQEVMVGLDLLDLSFTVLLEKFKENCSLLFFLEPRRKILKKIEKEVRTLLSEQLDATEKSEYGEHWQKVLNRLEIFRAFIRGAMKQMNMMCSLPLAPETTEVEDPKVQMNEQIARLTAVLEQFPGFSSLYLTEVAKIVALILGCSKDYAAKTLSSFRENYQGKDTKYTGWTYLEEARKDVQHSLEGILRKLIGK